MEERERRLSAELKEFLVGRFLANQDITAKEFCSIYGILPRNLGEWVKRYEKYGRTGLERMGPEGPAGGDAGVPERELRLEVMRLRIGIERLKRGYTARRGENGRTEYATMERPEPE